MCVCIYCIAIAISNLKHVCKTISTFFFYTASYLIGYSTPVYTLSKICYDNRKMRHVGQD